MNKKLYLLLIIFIFISCTSKYFPESGNSDIEKGDGGGQSVGNNYILPKGSLSQEEQKRPYDPNVNTTILFKKGDFNSKYFRIPALIVTKRGTILAATDRRYNKTADLGKSSKIDVIIRRSEDLGNTWSSPIVVGPGATKDDGSDSYGDPFFINTEDGSIVLGVVKNPGFQRDAETLIYKSTDDGKTWREVHKFLASSISGVSRGFAASGQGVTLRYGNNKGKLMFAFFGAGSPNKIYSMLSTDSGNTWRASGGSTPTDGQLDETKIIELSDGTLMMNHRRSVQQGQRSWSISRDGGMNWSFQGVDPEVDDPGNNADLSRYEFNGKPIKTEKYILFINSKGKGGGGWFYNRKNHHVKLTKNEFNNGLGTSTGKYAYDKQLVNGGNNIYSGYPTITVLPDGSICTLTEEVSIGESKEQDDYNIVFRRFNLYWLTDGKEYVDYSKDYLFQQPQY